MVILPPYTLRTLHLFCSNRIRPGEATLDTLAPTQSFGWAWDLDLAIEIAGEICWAKTAASKK